MATTTSKKIIVTGDDLNPALNKAFGDVVGSSLDKEMLVWLNGVDLMARGIVTVRGMQVTLENVITEKGNLPTLTTSSVQYWAKAYELRQLKGGEKKTLKQLFQLAREASAFVNASNKGKPKKEAKSFSDVITGKTIEEVRSKVPTQGAVKKRKASTDKNTKFTEKGVSINALIEALNKRLKSGKDKPDMKKLEALVETLNEIMFEGEEVAA